MSSCRSIPATLHPDSRPALVRATSCCYQVLRTLINIYSQEIITFLGKTVLSYPCRICPSPLDAVIILHARLFRAIVILILFIKPTKGCWISANGRTIHIKSDADRFAFIFIFDYSRLTLPKYERYLKNGWFLRL